MGCSARHSERTGAVAITRDEIEREKQALPRGWGRFGKALDRLAEISGPNESLLGSCAALNPEYRQTGRYVPGSALSIASDLRKSTNVVLACTNERLIMISTGITGAPRDDVTISYDDLKIVERAHRVFVISVPDGRIKIRGAHKQQIPLFLGVLESQARPAPEPSESGG
jgi:hypothetical protein